MNDEEKYFTLTEPQLQRIIETAVVNAMRELKEEDKLPGNEVNDREEEPEVFSLLENTATEILSLVILVCVLMIIAGIVTIVKNGFSILYLALGFDFGIIGWYSFRAIRELHKTKKIEVLNTIFSAIMALASLTVAVASAYFAYKSIGGGVT